ncbi:MAG: hypothetical protein POELPBGB_03272 [Bacteroidia bacterium]|nr:hypothetical protein [Bacteroidia bacterium]
MIFPVYYNLMFGELRRNYSCFLRFGFNFRIQSGRKNILFLKQVAKVSKIEISVKLID